MKRPWAGAGVAILLVVAWTPDASTAENVWPGSIPYVHVNGAFLAGTPAPIESLPPIEGNATAAHFPFTTDGCHLQFRFQLTWRPGGITAEIDPSNSVFLGTPMKVELHQPRSGPLPVKVWTGSGGQLLGALAEPLENETGYEVRIHYVAGLSANYTILALGTRPEENGCVLVNEKEHNPAGTDAGNEWVELYNPTPRWVDVGGWVLESSHGEIEAHDLPAPLRLAPGAFQVITFPTQFLDNSGDSVKLVHPAGSIVDETDWHADIANDGRTWQRVPDASFLWEFRAGTAGATNG